MTKANPGIHIKKGKKQNPVMTMIVPGRRSLGEDWSKVTVTPDADTGSYEVEREDTAAPPLGVPIFVPALGNVSLEMADYILERHRKEQEYKKNDPRRQHSPTLEAQIKQYWLDYIEQKLKAFKGITVSGPGGWTQRERTDYAKD